MEGQVQQFQTPHIGSLWFYVPIGHVMTLLSQKKLLSSTGSLVSFQNHQQNMNC
jgi:hypothetical protein